jgi:hypothetical protein
MKKHRLDLDDLGVQSLDTLPSTEAYVTHESNNQCVSEHSVCGVCPSDPCPLTAAG